MPPASTSKGKKFLLRHIGNMGDLIFFAPPVLAGLKKQHPDAHITFVTAWGYKDGRGRWGKRNMGGHGIHLMMTSPHIDQLVHWHDTKLSLSGGICREEGSSYPTWSRAYYTDQKESGNYDGVFELDVGMAPEENPLTKLFALAQLPADTATTYRLYLSDHDRAVAAAVLERAPRPRIVLLESLSGKSTRAWDPAKTVELEKAITKTYGTPPLWFGAAYTPLYQGRPLSLRENIAQLELCDTGIGVLSGPLHFAAAVGLPTLTLYCDHAIQRAAPAYFCGPLHRTLLGPSPDTLGLLKYDQRVPHLTPREEAAQGFISWQKPGRQATKSCLAAITVDEVMSVLNDMMSQRNISHAS